MSTTVAGVLLGPRTLGLMSPARGLCLMTRGGGNPANLKTEA